MTNPQRVILPGWSRPILTRPPGPVVARPYGGSGGRPEAARGGHRRAAVCPTPGTPPPVPTSTSEGWRTAEKRPTTWTVMALRRGGARLRPGSRSYGSVEERSVHTGKVAGSIPARTTTQRTRSPSGAACVCRFRDNAGPGTTQGRGQQSTGENEGRGARKGRGATKHLRQRRTGGTERVPAGVVCVTAGPP